MTCIGDLLEKIGHANFSPLLIWVKGIGRCPLEEKSKTYTIFLTPLGLFQFLVMSFGVHGALATFQPLMDRVLQDCVAANMDDVVNLQSYLERIHIYNISIFNKCWGKSKQLI